MTTNTCKNLKEEIERLNKLLERLEALQVIIEELNKDLESVGFTHMSDTEIQNKIYVLQDHLKRKLLEAYKTGCIDWVVQDEKV